MFIHKSLLPDDVNVVGVTTCQRRDNIVTISVLVVVNVHFEPDQDLTDPRERLRLISLHWPRCPEAFGVIVGDFNMREPEEGRFSVWNQTFTEGVRGKRSFSVPFASMSLKLRSLAFQGKTLLLMVRYAHCPELTEHLLIFLWLWHCFSHVSDSLGERSIPNDNVAVRLGLEKPTIRCDHAKRVLGWMSKHPVFCSIFTRISEVHQNSHDPFAALAG